jgi:hypothetical protein
MMESWLRLQLAPMLLLPTSKKTLFLQDLRDLKQSLYLFLTTKKI